MVCVVCMCEVCEEYVYIYVLCVYMCLYMLCIHTYGACVYVMCGIYVYLCICVWHMGGVCVVCI